MGIRKTNASESLKMCRYGISVTKTRVSFGSGMSLAGARFLGQAVSGMEAT
jgi:hypothetical protein